MDICETFLDQARTYYPWNQLHEHRRAAVPKAPMTVSTLRTTMDEIKPSFTMSVRLSMSIMKDELLGLLNAFVAKPEPFRQCKFNGHTLPRQGVKLGQAICCADCGVLINSQSELRETDRAVAMYNNRTECADLVDYWVDERHNRPGQFSRLSQRLTKH